ncbi:MAG TPA: M6 family metalloprotease domain-containing protein [Phycisphaerae bacterium]|nr:M6 family metalloprotease domain-containing protein [Phycisphaerales bacterium]HRX86227.1 M6 family metalloprotease domain-containing protein [Phycisphaerae bacterium]
MLVAVLAFAPRGAEAMPANPEPVDLRQPDGSVVTLRVFGDEYFHWYADLDGYTVVTAHGAYVYASLDDDGELAPTEWAVGKADPAAVGLVPGVLPAARVRAEHRAAALVEPVDRPRSAATKTRQGGAVKNLVVLCKFSDHTLGVHTRAAADYDVLWNAVGGDPVLAPTGSVRDCFLENSYGTLTVNSTVAAWVTLPHPEAYYANGTSGLGGSYPTNPQGMVEDALNAVDALVDFGAFDQDNDGYVDAISIIHSGYGAETGGGGGDWIWSHRWSLWQLPAGQWFSSDVNGAGQLVKVYDYHTEPALWGTSGTEISRIGVAVHETGHFFGLPDLYDTSGGGEGIGSYCMMANSWGFDFTQWHPPHFSAWCKAFLGWVTPTVITGYGSYTLPQVETTPTVYRIDAGYPSGEYLLIENRQPVGYDVAMPQGGLAIWHIDEAKCCNTDEGYPGQAGWPQNNNHYRVALLQADGNYDLERGLHRGEGDELYHAGGVSAIGPQTVPDTDAYQGGNVYPTYISIGSISAAGASMTFNYQADCNGNAIADNVDIAAGTSADCNGNATPDECEIGSAFNVNSPALTPIGTGNPQTHTFVAPPEALGPVTVRFATIGDFSSSSEWVDVALNGSPIGTVFNDGSDCPADPDTDAISIPAATFNALVAGGNATIDMVATSAVNPTLCGSGTYIQVTLDYAVASATCNGNGILDECDILGGTSVDCDGNGTPDECDTALYGVLLDATFESGLPAGWSASGIMQAGAACGAASPDCGGAGWMYAGDPITCAYGDDEAGMLTAPSVVLGYGNNALSFCSRLATEAGYDFAAVRVNGQVVWQESGGSGNWETHIVDLHRFGGQSVVVAFELSSDSFVSGTLGWQIDNVYLASGAPDCNGNGSPDGCDLDAGSSDCNANALPDECEAGGPVDFNLDGIVDLLDMDAFVNCLSGPDGAVVGGCCARADLDADGDVDLEDARALQRAYAWLP